jgi:hypothetical protein
MKAIRGKILCFYFVGDFDVYPFVNMPLSVLPEVMSQIEGDGKHYAMYRLLLSVPDLCNVSIRVSQKHLGNKRQKMSSDSSSSN